MRDGKPDKPRTKLLKKKREKSEKKNEKRKVIDTSTVMSEI